MDRQQEALKLQRQTQNREKRRAQGHRNDDGAYDDTKPRKKRAEPLKAAQQAYAAVMAAAALAPQPVQRCELCQASFVTEAQLQQHLEGPVHKKAVEKAAKEAAKQAHLNQHSAVAQEALAAAAWLSGGSSAPAAGAAGSNHHHHTPQQQQQQQQQGRQQGKQQQQQKQQQKGHQGWGPGGRGNPVSREEQLTHEQVLAAAKQDSGPLSIDGWVPPSVPSQSAPQPAATKNQGSQQLAGGTESQPNTTAADDSPQAAAAHTELPAAAPSGGAEQPTADAAGGDGAESGNSSSGSSGGSSESDDEDDVPQTFESFFLLR